jgi:hypothetical protein
MSDKLERLYSRMGTHPHIPISVIDFLKNDLQIGLKYVALISGDHSGLFAKLWHKHVHTLCILEPDKDTQFVIKRNLDPIKNYLIINSALENSNSEADSLDTAVLIGDSFINSLKIEQTKAELKKILKLNSYVIGITQHLKNEEERSFSWAYSHFYKQYSEIEFQEYEENIDPHITSNFFESGFESKIFFNQSRLNWENLQAYYLSSKGALNKEHPRSSIAIKALKIIFEQYQKEGEVSLDYQTILYYGLYNKYVPAISLRKNLFFKILKPFAIGFYVLAKINIYLWKFLGILFNKKKK